MSEEAHDGQFPGGLTEWAGNRSGGVRRMFDEDSGRPNGTNLKTRLLEKLRDWCLGVAQGRPGLPRIVLLVGGPGNGKTQAIEATVGWLDEFLDPGTADDTRSKFQPEDGSLVQRSIQLDFVRPEGGDVLRVRVVQDASLDDLDGASTAPRLLIDDLSGALGGKETDFYLCCVNRGILDDALIMATERAATGPRDLLEAITRSVSLSPDAPPCWPLEQYPDVAVWPMDAESLLMPQVEGELAPAQELLAFAIEAARWKALGTCEAGPSCPFCGSRALLAGKEAFAALLDILRWYELGSGKRWSFRDLFSLASFILAGHRVSQRDADLSPCGWANKLMALDADAKRLTKPDRIRSTALFELVAAQYQHALFHHWDQDAASTLATEIRLLGLQNDNTAMGLQWFLANRRPGYLPAMIAQPLEGIVEFLDPAFAPTSGPVKVTARRTIDLAELDIRFSRSVREGLEMSRGVVSELEAELLGRLATLEEYLAKPASRKKRPMSATTVQRLLRDFASRLVRRSIGARVGALRHAPIFREFEKVLVDPDGDGIYAVASEVEDLLNAGDSFEVNLTTTFGQPQPSELKRATLVVPRRHVRPASPPLPGRPRPPVAFLSVGEGQAAQPVALTFDLFLAVKELESGMSAASLPRTVRALLDTARARLSGPLVRNPSVLERAFMRIGASGLEVERRRVGFGRRRKGIPR